MHRRFRLAHVFAATLVLIFFGGCTSSESERSSNSLTAANIQERVATALRDAETFQFDMTILEPNSNGDDVVTTGEIAYDSAGEVVRIGYIQNGGVVEDGGVEYRFVDGDTYHRASADGEFRKLAGAETEAFVKAWDWAAAVEADPAVEEVSEQGSDEVDGIETTKYELTFKDRTETWWIDSEERLIRQKTDDVESRLSGFGEPVDIAVP